MKTRTWFAALVALLPPPASAAPALQVTRLTGDLEVMSEKRDPERLPSIAGDSEVHMLSGRGWFEAPVHARIAAVAGDWFRVRRIPSRGDAVEIEALGGSTLLDLRIGGASFIVRSGAVVVLSAFSGSGRVEVVRRPVEVTSAMIGPEERIEGIWDLEKGPGPGDVLFVKVPPTEGFDEAPVPAEMLKVNVEEKPGATRLTASMRADFASWPPPEPDLRSAVGEKPGLAHPPQSPPSGPTKHVP